jgi:hypothetical protein
MTDRVIRSLFRRWRHEIIADLTPVSMQWALEQERETVKALMALLDVKIAALTDDDLTHSQHHHQKDV